MWCDLSAFLRYFYKYLVLFEFTFNPQLSKFFLFFMNTHPTLICRMYIRKYRRFPTKSSLSRSFAPDRVPFRNCTAPSGLYQEEAFASLTATGIKDPLSEAIAYNETLFHYSEPPVSHSPNDLLIVIFPSSNCCLCCLNRFLLCFYCHHATRLRIS